MSDRPPTVCWTGALLGFAVEILVGDLGLIECDAIVCPANSYGTMGGGVAAALVRRGGRAIEAEAVARSPIPLGTAVVTTPGSLHSLAVIHAPTMRNPVERAKAANVGRSVRAALEAAEGAGFASVAFPGMGTGTGSLPYDTAAAAMLGAIAGSTDLRAVVLVKLVAFDGDLADAWRAAAEGIGSPA